jgi:hypothetical protein
MSKPINILIIGAQLWTHIDDVARTMALIEAPCESSTTSTLESKS